MGFSKDILSSSRIQVELIGLKSLHIDQQRKQPSWIQKYLLPSWLWIHSPTHPSWSWRSTPCDNFHMSQWRKWTLHSTYIENTKPPSLLWPFLSVLNMGSTPPLWLDQMSKFSSTLYLPPRTSWAFHSSCSCLHLDHLELSTFASSTSLPCTVSHPPRWCWTFLSRVNPRLILFFSIQKMIPISVFSFLNL